jgi:hypothetical protein
MSDMHPNLINRIHQRDYAAWINTAHSGIERARTHACLEEYAQACKRAARAALQMAADLRAEHIAEMRGFQTHYSDFAGWDRDYAYSCVEDGYDGAPDSSYPVGWGITRADAIRDLLWHIEEKA